MRGPHHGAPLTETIRHGNLTNTSVVTLTSYYLWTYVIDMAVVFCHTQSIIQQR